MNLLPTLGFLGSVCFVVAGFPSAWRAHKNGKSDLPPITTWSILIGLILSYSYLHASRGFDYVVAVMYGVEVATWLYVLRWLMWPRVPTAPPAPTIKFTGTVAKVWRAEGRTDEEAKR